MSVSSIITNEMEGIVNNARLATRSHIPFPFVLCDKHSTKSTRMSLPIRVVLGVLQEDLASLFACIFCMLPLISLAMKMELGVIALIDIQCDFFHNTLLLQMALLLWVVNRMEWVESDAISNHDTDNLQQFVISFYFQIQSPLDDSMCFLEMW